MNLLTDPIFIELRAMTNFNKTDFKPFEVPITRKMVVLDDDFQIMLTREVSDWLEANVEEAPSFRWDAAHFALGFDDLQNYTMFKCRFGG